MSVTHNDETLAAAIVALEERGVDIDVVDDLEAVRSAVLARLPHDADWDGANVIMVVGTRALERAAERILHKEDPRRIHLVLVREAAA
jgi:methyl coenzyme M reductase beta subunit